MSNQPLAPKPKRTLAEFIYCVPKEWMNAEVGVWHNLGSSSPNGFYRVRRVVLTIDADGRRCVIFSSNPTQFSDSL